MKTPGLYLPTWIRRLGVQRVGWTPEHHEIIQPVSIVADASRLVSPLNPPWAIAGMDLVKAAPGNIGISFQCRAPGGAWILQWALGAVAAANYAFRISPTTNPDAGIATVTPPFNMGPEPVLSELKYGEPAAVVMGQNQPMFRVGAANAIVFTEPLFVPPGFFFLIEQDSGGTSQTITFYMNWREYPAPS